MDIPSWTWVLRLYLNIDPQHLTIPMWDRVSYLPLLFWTLRPRKVQSIIMIRTVHSVALDSRGGSRPWVDVALNSSSPLCSPAQYHWPSLISMWDKLSHLPLLFWTLRSRKIQSNIMIRTVHSVTSDSRGGSHPWIDVALSFSSPLCSPAQSHPVQRPHRVRSDTIILHPGPIGPWRDKSLGSQVELLGLRLANLKWIFQIEVECLDST